MPILNETFSFLEAVPKGIVFSPKKISNQNGKKGFFVQIGLSHPIHSFRIEHIQFHLKVLKCRRYIFINFFIELPLMSKSISVTQVVI